MGERRGDRDSHCVGRGQERKKERDREREREREREVFTYRILALTVLSLLSK